MRKRIVCFGDSNTWGYCAVDGSRYEDEIRWTGKLQALLGKDYTVIEEGQNGRTTVWDDVVENRLAGLTYLWPCMESHSPFDLLILMLGTNDTKPQFSVPALSIANSAGRLVDLAQKSTFGRDNKAPQVLLVSPIRLEMPNALPHLFGEQAVKTAEGFSPAYRAVAAQYGVHFLDAAEIAGPCKEDGIHLGQEGHDKLARAMRDEVSRILA